MLRFASIMIAFPNSKINLGLNIVSKRSDGFHELRTLFYPISLRDSLEIIPTKENQDSFTSSGIPIPEDKKGNLCEQAIAMVREDYDFPQVQMHLHKNIPIGAGLGGGSADAVFTILLLKNLFDLEITRDELHVMAGRLGSDCPFFLENQPCLAYGRGEILQPFSLNLKGYHLFLAMPAIHVSTREAFSAITPQKPSENIAEWLVRPPDKWKQKVVNDFEEGVFSIYPRIGELKTIFYSFGAEYASMSGSGASVFGIFSHKPGTAIYKKLQDCFIWEEELT